VRGPGAAPALARAIAILVVVGLGAAASSCGSGGSEAPAASTSDPLSPLHALESTRRAATDFRSLPASDRSRGADPYRIAALPPGPGVARFVGILRGRDAVVLLDAALREIDRRPTAASPSGLAVSPKGEVVVVGEQSTAIHRYLVQGDHLLPQPSLESRALTMRDVAVGPEGVVYAVEERDGRLLSIRASTGEIHEMPAGIGPFRVDRVGSRVLVDGLLDHTLVARDVDAEGLPRAEGAVTIHHDGPIWGFAAIDDGGDLVIAAGGVEDHRLDRTGGSFGYVDSFVWFYRITRGAREAERIAEINVSALGVVTPKALVLRAKDGGLEARVAGYGSDRLLTITLGSKGSTTPPATTTSALLPGVAAMVAGEGDTIVAADPLLDAWLSLSNTNGAVISVPAADPGEHPPAPTPQSRLGEALFFTTAMAPWNSSEGPLSRFTCETCHFEGHVDGRTHSTGRGDIVATTKPLLGLFNNRPHFSRALDPDLTSVANNEFRVAGANSGHEPWFSAAVVEQPWIRGLGVADAELDATSLRKALMVFLMDFTHRPNPMALDHAAFSPLERAGAEAFARRCEGCHAARLVTDEPASRVDPAGWERLVLSREGPIVWGLDEYRMTGIEPYVHPRGARVPSLRRLYEKRPYFTNGAASTLADVLSRARFQGATGFFHDRAPDGAESLRPSESEALLAFLALL
jgi:hypothetical protein